MDQIITEKEAWAGDNLITISSIHMIQRMSIGWRTFYFSAHIVRNSRYVNMHVLLSRRVTCCMCTLIFWLFSLFAITSAYYVFWLHVFGCKQHPWTVLSGPMWPRTGKITLLPCPHLHHFHFTRIMNGFRSNLWQELPPTDNWLHFGKNSTRDMRRWHNRTFKSTSNRHSQWLHKMSQYAV